jgi:hypothetical protein
MSVSCGTRRFVISTLLAFLLTLLCHFTLTLLAPGLHAIFVGHRGGVTQIWRFASENLQGSISLFAVVFVAYVSQMVGLKRLFRRKRPPVDLVVRKEQLLDLCASLFFGIGVIWTAIGMRGALLFALGDTSQVTADSGMAVLQRLVEGGILLALSTTIVGGMGGYLMRAGKQLVFGRQLALLYLDATNAFPGVEGCIFARTRSEPGAGDTALAEESIR